VALITNPKSLKITLRQLLPLALACVVFFTMASFYYMAIQNSSTSTAAVILNMAPVFVMVFSTVFWGERFTLRKGLAVGAAVIGCALVTGIVGGVVFAPIGILYAFLSCVSYATYSISVRTAAKRGVTAATSNTYIFLIASIVACFVAGPRELVNRAVSVSPWILLALIGFGAVTGFLASFLYTKAMEKLPAGVVASMSAIEPLTLTVTGIVFLHDKITVYSAIGMVMILVSVFVLSLENNENS
jgi:drug/metabolite transporter (DMT)-like permease